MADKNFAKVSDALKALGEAVRNLEDAFESVDEGKLNDYIAQGYPFQRSFNELAFEVTEWVEDSRTRILNDLRKEEADV